jgi:hypothetical protein
MDEARGGIVERGAIGLGEDAHPTSAIERSTTTARTRAI